MFQLTLLNLFGCASIGPTYEGDRENILNDDRQYKLAAIEFGELGSYADPCKGELNNTIQLLKNTERPLLVVYIDAQPRIGFGLDQAARQRSL